MSEKRKDSKGRILRTGESQRKDGLYQYRYTDISKVRRTVYAPDLKELRVKEEAIYEELKMRIDIAGSKKTVYELCERHFEMKRPILRDSTYISHKYLLTAKRHYPIYSKRVCDVTVSDAKSFIIELSKNGLKFGTIRVIHSIMKLAFEAACCDNLILKNPFAFLTASVIKNDSVPVCALTPQQVSRLLAFSKEDPVCKRYYDDIIVLIGTGLRASEYCGLTVSDVDFKARTISVTHQLLTGYNGIRYISAPKTASGVRTIPMSNAVYESLRRIVLNRVPAKKDAVIDGYTDFIMLNRSRRPKNVDLLEHEINVVRDKYNKANPDLPIDRMTPHVLRHTFCTNLVNSGMDVTGVQYLMGHSNANVTLSVYTHASYEHAASEMARLEGKKSIELPTK